MRKYILTCICPSYIVSEINKTFYLRDTWVLSEKEYNQPFVQRLLRMGVFSVAIKQECRMKKKPPTTKIPPFVKMRGGVPKTTPTPPSQQGVSEQSLKDIVQAEMAQMKQQIVQEISGELSSMLQQQGGAQMDMEALGKLITQSIQASLPVGGVAPAQQVQATPIDEDDEPIYIPSNITGSGIVSGSSMSVESISTDDSVSDAASALRAMKKKRKK